MRKQWDWKKKLNYRQNTLPINLDGNKYSSCVPNQKNFTDQNE